MMPTASSRARTASASSKSLACANRRCGSGMQSAMEALICTLQMRRARSSVGDNHGRSACHCFSSRCMSCPFAPSWLQGQPPHPELHEGRAIEAWGQTLVSGSNDSAAGVRGTLNAAAWLSMRCAHNEACSMNTISEAGTVFHTVQVNEKYAQTRTLRAAPRLSMRCATSSSVRFARLSAMALSSCKDTRIPMRF